MWGAPVAQFKVTAEAFDGMSGEGPFIFQAGSEEQALEQYVLFATQGGGKPHPKLLIERA